MHWEPRGEDWGVPSLHLSARSDSSLHSALPTQGSVVWTGWRPPSSQDHILDSFLFPLAPAHCLAHRCSISVYWTKEGNSNFTLHLFNIIPIFMWKLQNPFRTPLSQRKVQACPWLALPSFCGPWWETCIFFTLLFLVTFSSLRRCSFQLWLAQPCLF